MDKAVPSGSSVATSRFVSLMKDENDASRGSIFTFVNENVHFQAVLDGLAAQDSFRLSFLCVKMQQLLHIRSVWETEKSAPAA